MDKEVSKRRNLYVDITNDLQAKVSSFRKAALSDFLNLNNKLLTCCTKVH